MPYTGSEYLPMQPGLLRSRCSDGPIGLSRRSASNLSQGEKAKRALRSESNDRLNHPGAGRRFKRGSRTTLFCELAARQMKSHRGEVTLLADHETIGQQFSDGLDVECPEPVERRRNDFLCIPMEFGDKRRRKANVWRHKVQKSRRIGTEYVFDKPIKLRT